ncbi:hypothetical protein NDU88_009264 [Pleurodeles waltl]|uniref:Uncharacterized protein n=1 Tax=Pleurodeles waltl TaxID=8319 RepID=A0AAV7RZZ5_PLEWA|nr:hypothetical protein NDU88_009264 [Pleurodeles waltl]
MARKVPACRWRLCSIRRLEPARRKRKHMIYSVLKNNEICLEPKNEKQQSLREQVIPEAHENGGSDV